MGTGGQDKIADGQICLPLRICELGGGEQACGRVDEGYVPLCTVPNWQGRRLVYAPPTPYCSFLVFDGLA
jgi:hypothetical protein